MRGGLVEEDNIETVSLVLAKLLEKDGEAGSIEAGQFPPEGVSRGGLHGRIQPVLLIEGLDDLDRLDAIGRQPPVERQVETQARFILAEEPYGLVGRLPP